MAVNNGSTMSSGTISERSDRRLVLTGLQEFYSSTLGLIIFAVSFMTPIVAETGDTRARVVHGPRWVAIFAAAVGLGLIFLALVGYVGLARFLATQSSSMVRWSSRLYIASCGKGDLRARPTSVTRVGRYLQRRFLLNPVALD